MIFSARGEVEPEGASLRDAVRGYGDEPMSEQIAQQLSLSDQLRLQDMRWCANCGGLKLFIPVSEFERPEKN